MIVPTSYFLSMPARSACDNSMETGAPIAGEDGVARYIRSIAELHDVRGTLAAGSTSLLTRTAARRSTCKGNAT